MERRQNLEHTSLLVLSLLSREDMYGYQMITEIQKKLDSSFTMKEGTLYPILKKLEASEAVESYEQPVPGGRIRKYYHLTAAGRQLLRREEEAWHTYEKSINQILKCESGGILPEGS
ncbi:MAG: helix-turn-helix transcriptional regulator [Clostridiales bacterium]|nr:helix-turn-helix transcriptional regulator [Clostridiales bacterium]